MPSITNLVKEAVLPNSKATPQPPANRAQTIDVNTTTKSNSGDGVDLEKHPHAAELVDRIGDFLTKIEDLTPGHELEALLNKQYGPGNEYYEDFCRLIKVGLEEGWAANVELDGPKYRRSRIAAPSLKTRYCSITTVYMEDVKHYAGQYHKHPYGEINCVVQLSPDAELKGFQGWQGPGWTCPAAGTHHYPEVRGGALVALFFLPAGRISYKATPDEQQPAFV